MVAVCRSCGRCSHKKANDWKPDFIDPVSEDARDFFAYEDAMVVATLKDKKRSEYTRDLINLNDDIVVKMRRQYLKYAQQYKKSGLNKNELQVVLECLPSCSSYVEWLLSNYDAL